MNLHFKEGNTYANIFNDLQNEITFGGYFAALCSPSFLIVTSLMMNIRLDLPILFIAYFLPLIVYSYDYYKDIDKDIVDNSERANYLKKNAKNYPFLLAIYIILLGSLLIIFSNYNLIYFILLLITVGILYNVALKNITKKIHLFKNIYTALTWAIGAAIFPVLYYSLTINPIVLIAFLTIFLRCLNNILFFDLKDFETDKKEKLKTLPVIMGKNRAITILYILNVISFIPLIYGVYMHLIPLYTISLTLFGIYSFYYLKKAKNATSNQLETVSHTLADLEFILWPLLLLTVKFLI
jgi:4-hydroxybenzoate polyprenyltransferase